jgi:hypothetical protein
MIAPMKIRWKVKELLEFDLIKKFVAKNMKCEKQVLTVKKMRDWAGFPLMKKLGLLYLATQMDFK